MEYRSLFLWKFNNKLQIQSRDLNNREHKQKVFFQQKRDIVFSNLSKKKRAFLCTENGQQKGKYWVKAEFSEKTLQK